MNANRRRLFPIVNKSLQYRFLAIIIIYMFLIAIFLGSSIFIPDILSLQNETLAFETKAHIASRLITFHVRLWPTLIVLVCIIGIHSFFIFHRLIGPLYRFQWAYDQIRQGNLGFRVRIRKKDYLHDDEDKINVMVESLRENMHAIQHEGNEVVKTLNELEKAFDPQDMTISQRKLFDEHREYLQCLIAKTQYFRVDSTV